MVDDQVRSALVGPLSELGLVLDDLSIVPAGRRRVVRVAVDRDLRELPADDTTSPVPPLTLDEVAEATRLISDVLDGTHGRSATQGEDATPGADAAAGEPVELMGAAPYTLEVSSPGLDRPLHGHRAFRRNVGRLVAFVLGSGEEVTARMLSVAPSPDGGTVLVEVPAARKQPATRRELRLDEVTSARVQVEFNRPDAGVAADETPYDETDDADETDETDETPYDDTHETHETDETHEETDDGH